VIAETQVPETYIEQFEQRRRQAEPGWLSALRQDGFALFTETGFPTTHDEDWRFTSITPISRTEFQPAPAIKLDPAALESFGISEFVCRLVFVNGRFAPELCRFPSLPKGVILGSLAEQIAANPGLVEQHLGQHLNIRRDAFAALNTAFFEDGAFVYVPRNTVLLHPVYVLFVSAGADAPMVEHPRSLIIAEENSQVSVVEDYVTVEDGNSAAFSNTATELIAGSGAVASHFMLVRQGGKSFNVSTLRIQQERSSNVSTHSFLLSSALVRNNVHPVLNGEGAECLINGLFMASSGQHMDNYMLVEHAAPHCDSRQFYNGILSGNGHGVFHGRIIVHKDAQKTDAKQTNRNLLLSDNAQIDTKPQLEIYADDVKCTHGATIGQVDETALFYLRSRGLDEVSARHILLLAFANECLDRVAGHAMRSHLQHLVMASLPEKARDESGKQPAERAWEEVG